VKAAAESFRMKVELYDVEKLKDGPLVFSPTPELYSSPPDVDESTEIPSQPKRLLLYGKHYYPLHPKNSFPNVPKDSKYVVKLQSPFEKAPDTNDADTDSLSAPSEESDPELNDQESTQVTPEELLATSRPMDGPLTDEATRQNSDISPASNIKSLPNTQVSLPSQDSQGPVQDKPLDRLGNAMVGFFAGAGLITTAYGLFLGGKFLYKKLFNRRPGRERRRLKRRVVNLMLDE
jgi:hypothetical protein